MPTGMGTTCGYLWVAHHHSTAIIDNTTLPHFTATPNAGQNHTNTVENGTASMWRGAGVQGTPEVFSFYSIVLIVYVFSQPPPQCPHPTSCYPTHPSPVHQQA